MTIRRSNNTAVNKTQLIALGTEVPQPKVYTFAEDIYITEHGEGQKAVEGVRKLAIKAGVPVTEAQINKLFPTAAVASISPSTGLPAAGGTVVTIKGSNLYGATGVTFGGTAGTAFAVQADGSIKVTTPAKAAGTYNVVVQDDTADVTVTNAVTYV